MRDNDIYSDSHQQRIGTPPLSLSLQVVEENPDPATTLLTFLRYQNQFEADFLFYFYLDSND